MDETDEQIHRLVVSLDCLNIVDLDLSNRNLTVLPNAISQLKSLTKLNCSHNPLTALPEAVASLIELRTIFFLGCSFVEIPLVLAHLPKLFMLSFKSNLLTSISEECLSSSLGWLILTDNRQAICKVECFLSSKIALAFLQTHSPA